MEKKIKEFVNIELLFYKQAKCIEAIPITETYDKVIKRIYWITKEVDGCVFTTGIGKAGQVAKQLASTFCSTGTPAIFLHPSEAQHGDLGIQQCRAVLIAFSNSGKTREVLELVKLMQNIDPLINIVVITSDPLSPLAHEAQYLLLTGAPEELCPLGLTPTSSIIAMTAISNVLVVSMMKKINFTKEQYALVHHGGYLGQKARKDASK